jgi:hypothetical protein
MNWIERTVHVSPDGGNGSIELVLLLVLSAVVAVAIRRCARQIRRQ